MVRNGNSAPLSPRLALPAEAQAVIDETYANFFAEVGITDDMLNLDSITYHDLLDGKVQSVRGTTLPIGSVENHSKHHMMTQKLLGGVTMRAIEVTSNFWMPENSQQPRTWNEMINFPAKSIKLDCLSEQKAKRGRWELQYSPDAPPVMYNFADMIYAHEHTEAEDGLMNATGVAKAFGPESVIYLDDTEAQDVIDLIRNPRNDWRVIEDEA